VTVTSGLLLQDTWHAAVGGRHDTPYILLMSAHYAYRF
jgi:hypothetical protein